MVKMTPTAGKRMPKERPCKKCGGRHIPPTGASVDNSHLSLHSTMHKAADQTAGENTLLRSSPVTSPARAVLTQQVIAPVNLVLAAQATDTLALTNQVTLLTQTLVAVSSRIDGITEHLLLRRLIVMLHFGQKLTIF